MLTHTTNKYDKNLDNLGIFRLWIIYLLYNQFYFKNLQQQICHGSHSGVGAEGTSVCSLAVCWGFLTEHRLAPNDPPLPPKHQGYSCELPRQTYLSEF